MIRLWDAATGKLIHQLRQGAKQLRYRKVAISPDGRIVAAIDAMGAVAHVWDANTGVAMATLDNDSSEAASLAFSADGRWLASGGGNDVRVFDTDTWVRVVTIAGPDALALAWDPKGPRLATGTGGGDASIWEIPSGVRVRHIRDGGDLVSAVAFSPDGKLLAVVTRNGSEQVFQVHSGELRSQIELRRGKILSVEFDSTSRLLVAANADGTAVVFDIIRGLPAAVLEGSEYLIIDAHFDSNARRVLAASWDGTARVWDATEPYRRNSAPSGMPISIPGRETSPNGRRLVTVTADEAPPVLWDAEHNQIVARLEGHVGRVWSAHFVNNGRWILTAGADATCRSASRLAAFRAGKSASLRPLWGGVEAGTKGRQCRPEGAHDHFSFVS